MKGSLPSPFTLFPQEVITDLDKDFWNYNDSGFCFPEISHRSENYAEINELSMDLIRKYFKVPQNYVIIYLPAQCGHPSIPFNLCKSTNNKGIYVVTDKQSQHAYQEALRINPETVKVGSLEARSNIFKDLKQGSSFYTFYSKLSFDQGFMTPQPENLKGQILVCSLNGCAYYEQVNVGNHGLVLIQSGKGIGLLGMSIVIVREDLVGHHLQTCPDLMDYKMMSGMKSIVNTPFTFVPLLIHRHLHHLLSAGLTLQKVKQQLKIIKEEYEQSLSKFSEIVETKCEGLIKFKIPGNKAKYAMKEYVVIEGDFALLILQLQNKGKSQDFIRQLFK